MQRHRNPSNGYRSNPMGIGGSGGGVAAGGPGYRNYNRSGFGRGQPPPPRRIDIFLEAGKLATEYLVSKGLLPPNSVNAKWQNSNLKTQIGGGDGVSDAVSGTSRRRLSDDYSGATGSRDGIRARRTTGSFKNPSFEYNHEINRSSSWSEKVKGSSDKQGDGDSYSGSMEEQRSGKDATSEDQKSVSGDLESKNQNTGNIETTIDNQQNQSPDDNSSIKTPSSDQVNVDDSKNPNLSTEEVITDDSNQDSEKPVVKEENHNNNSSSDLLTLIRFNKIPTRTRSSIKASKSDTGDKTGSENKNQELNYEQNIEEDQKYKFGQGVCTRSQSFPQRSSISEQESSEEQHHGYGRCNSDLLNRGEKRPLHDDHDVHLNDNTEGSKKLKDWTPTDPQTDDYTEEKQLFPSSLSSFKICDLNLMGGSEVHDNTHNHNHNQDTSKVIAFPTIGQQKQEPVTVDFDLSMNNTRRGADGKEVEIIDLDCEVQDDKDFTNSQRREEAIFTDLESFPDSMQRVSEMPQDGYGLMISELLEADIPNSSVSTGVNSMHNEISLQNEEGILGDDESIYMSLGEIPISFVPVWDQQPSQGYDKRY